ncbi:outer membrane protein assembly factor BamB family protein [Stieleria varia]|uniref:Outer membrane biogenesis protein BamB n=1 Tax=Stieleria varia TaxID=2528005 RepID=A0A5C6B8K3_9BACT|nr:PQQ-binding-like beta-propeller repeat protein [Stieleria varia]TWU07972.1 outer membrane biogenesis protein BamB [Stieleria varia]
MKSPAPTSFRALQPRNGIRQNYLWRLLTLCLSVLLASLIGCSEKSSSVDLELPLVEPTLADTPDAGAIAEYQQRAADALPSDAAATQAWTSLLGPNRNGWTAQSISPSWGDAMPALLWETPVGTGYGSPVAFGGKVIFNHRVDDTDIVECHGAVDGELLWKSEFPTTATCEYEYSDGPYSTPVIDPASARVFNVTGDGSMVCLELESGNILWQRDLNKEYSVAPELFPVGGSPYLDVSASRPGGQLIFNLGAADRGAGVISLDPTTGETIWESGRCGVGYCTPLVTTIHDQRFLFIFMDQGILCLDPDSGTIDWEETHFSRAPMSYNAVSPMCIDDKILAVTGPGPGAICLQIKPDRSHEVVWKNRRVIDCQYNALMLRDGYVYAFTAAGQGGAELRCVEFATGDLQWRYHSLLRRGQGLIANDVIVLLGESGHLAALECTPEQPKVLAFTKEPLMAGSCYCSPALDNGILILKDESRVAAFDVSGVAK